MARSPACPRAGDPVIAGPAPGAHPGTQSHTRDRYADYVSEATPSRRAEQPSHPRRWLILCICCLSLLIVGIDTTIVNVALPAIHRSLHASLSGLQWIIDAYALVLASFLMLGGSTADRIGRKRVFLTGLLTFIVGSAGCAVAPRLGVLIAARAFQAIGGSMLNPVALSIVRNAFRRPRELAQAVGVWGATLGFSIGIGPVLGGVFVDTIGWRFVFLVNIPVGLIAVALTAIHVPESRAEHARRIDLVGQALVIIALAALTYAIIEGGAEGWTSPVIMTLFAVTLAAFAALVPYELRHREPLIEFRFFRSAPFSGATAIAVSSFACFGAFLFLNTLYLQEARGFSALQAGLSTLPLAACMAILPPISGRIVGLRGNRIPLLIAGLGMIAGTLMLTGITAHTSIWLILAAYTVFGVGFGFINAPISNTAITGMPHSQTGVAAAIASASRQVGTTIGIAVVGVVVGAGSSGRSSATFGPGFAQATHPGWWLMVGFAIATLVLGVLSTTTRALESARATAARLDPGPVPV